MKFIHWLICALIIFEEGICLCIFPKFKAGLKLKETLPLASLQRESF
jgi:hypothetical protein